ncbi:hypothetical protein [Aureimonas sp. SK2]|uniref:hypothetical protein n=1 Tax=Aureimonas sp. SK2 TaxID=3015992 RepID=UPI002443AE1A|nr:hypothetical protein [Aureimonas sp. SK2]
MSDTPTPIDPAERPLTQREKADNKRDNEKCKLASSLFHSLALAIFGFSALRLLLDPAAQRPDLLTIIIAGVVAVVFEATAYYPLTKLKAES